MKKLLMFIVLVFLFSCEKQEEFCYDCVIACIVQWDTEREIEYLPPQEHCGFTERDAKMYERWKTTMPEIVNTCGVTKWTECICKKRDSL